MIVCKGEKRKRETEVKMLAETKELENPCQIEGFPHWE